MISNNPHSLGTTLHQLSVMLDRRSDLLLQQKYRIGFSQFKILTALLWEGNIQQRDIADFLGQTEASVSRQVSLLVGQGLLTSRRDPKNRRQKITSLTSKGEKTVESATAALESYHAPMFARLTISQQQNLQTTLDTMYAYVCAIEGRV